MANELRRELPASKSYDLVEVAASGAAPDKSTWRRRSRRRPAPPGSRPGFRRRSGRRRAGGKVGEHHRSSCTVEGLDPVSRANRADEPGGSGRGGPPRRAAPGWPLNGDGARHKLAVALRLLPDPQPSCSDDLGLRVAGRQRTGSGRRGTELIEELDDSGWFGRSGREPGNGPSTKPVSPRPIWGNSGTRNTFVNNPPCREAGPAGGPGLNAVASSTRAR
jgi:hypothetical protein